MTFKNKDIEIVDWTGKELFKGPYDSKNVDVVLDANRCDCVDRDDCDKCDSTGYWGDFEVSWVDESDKDDCNVYEHIYY